MTDHKYEEQKLDEMRYGKDMHFVCNTLHTTVEEFVEKVLGHLSPDSPVRQRPYFIFDHAYNADGELMPGSYAICCKKEDRIE